MALIANDKTFEQLKRSGRTPDGNPSFINEWNLVKYLGRGNFGTVFEIEKKSSSLGNQRSALKIIELGENSKSESVKKYKDEITALQAIRNHPHGVSIEDFSELTMGDGVYAESYLVIRMELLNKLPQNGLSEDEVICLGIDISDILTECHNMQPRILHRDIKPANILMAANGAYKLSDFGEAKFLDKSKGNTDSAEHGTPFYMAPEIAAYQEYNERSDLYSLGVTMYTLLNGGVVPFTDTNDDRTAIRKRLQGEKFPKIKGANAGIMRIIYKLCEIDPNKRYQRASQLNRDLKALVKKKEDEQRRREEAEIARQLKERQKTELARKKAEEKAKHEAAVKARMSAQFNMGSANETVKQKRAVNNAIDYGATIFERSVVADGSPIKNKKFSFELNRRNLTVIVACAAIAVIAVALTVYFSWHNSFVYVNGERLEKDVTDLVFNDVEIDNIEALKNYKNIEDVNLRNVELTESELELVYMLFSDTDIIIDVDVCRQKFGSRYTVIEFNGDIKISFDEISKKLKFFQNLKTIDISDCTVIEKDITNFISRFPEYNVIWNVDLFGQEYISTATDIDLSENKNVELEVLGRKLAYFSDLESIKLANINLSDDDLLEFRESHMNLRVNWTIDLHGCAFETNTKTITLDNIHIDDPEELKSKLKYFNQLSTLDIRSCTIDKEGAYLIAQEYPNLKFIWSVSLYGKKIQSNSATLLLAEKDIGSLEDLRNNLKYFNSLQSIDLSNCGFSSETLYDFEKTLNGIDVYWTVKFYGETYKTNITSLRLRSKNITDISTLKYFSKLQELYLSYGFTNGTYTWGTRGGISDISAIAELTELRKLSLWGNRISDISPLANLTKLEKLWIEHNNIRDITPLSNLKNLKVLSLDANRISDISPLANITGLNTLSISNNTINNISALSNLTALTELGLDDNKITNTTPLLKLTNLSRLTLGGNSISTDEKNNLNKSLSKCDITYSDNDSLSVKNELDIFELGAPM